MKKVLIVTYQFPPMNVISALRPFSFACNFKSLDIDPTVVTLNWEPDDAGGWKWHSGKLEHKREITNEYTCFRIPRQMTFLQKICNTLNGVPIASKCFTFLMNIFGFFELEVTHAYTNFRKFLDNHLGKQSYDLIIGLYSPFCIPRVCAEMGIKYNIPYVTDWRDLHDIRLTKEDFNPSLKEKVYLQIYNFWIGRIIRKSEFLTTVSSYYVDFFRRNFGIEGYEITNGYENQIFQEIAPLKGEKFTIAHVGTLYPDQRTDIFLEGLSKFLTNGVDKKVEIVFVGLKDEMLSEFPRRISEFPGLSDFFSLRPRVERLEAIALMKGADVLYYPAWLGTKGVYSGKFFEYVGSRRPILLAPGDEDFLEKKVKLGNLGEVAFESKEVVGFLNRKYQEWEEFEDVEYSGIETEIISCSREYQAKKYAEIILSHLA